MRYSTLFGKTERGEVKSSKFISHQLLTKAGFIRESSAGRYYFLPLGWRVHEKIRTIIQQEMDAIGAQEMLTPTLHPLSLWQESNRDRSVGFELMTVQDARGASFALGGTAEEMMVDVVRRFTLSYRELPFSIYQFSTKFRDELRARGGLLRVREFVMKDAYSFDRDAEAFADTYNAYAQAYQRTFERLGLDTWQVAADNGYIGGDYSHEFIVESAIGESLFFVSEDGSIIEHEDIARFYRAPINLDEALREMEIIEQPEWVKTMDDNQAHYGLPKARYLKNVVYRHLATDEIIIAVIRGDLEVSRVKLEHLLDAVGQLVEADDADLARIGTQRGWVHSWGHPGARYIGDLSLTTVRNFIGGQKAQHSDSINVNYGRDFECEQLADIATAQEGFLTVDGRQRLLAKRGIEVGNIFQIGTHYTDKMQGAVYVDEQGVERPLYMGSYGIGLGRTLAAYVEKYHDEQGIIWQPAIAPFQVHLLSLRGGEDYAAQLYQTLRAQGIEVLWDDRDESPGVKLSDADLIGIPLRLLLSRRTGDKVEWKGRTESSSQLLSLDEVLARLKAMGQA